MAPPEDFCRQDQLELFMTMMIILKIVKLKTHVILKSYKKMKLINMNIFHDS